MSLLSDEKKKNLRKLGVGLAFLAPNILGFVCFMLLPLVLSVVMAFTNWDLKLHNMFREQPLNFVGLQNFVRLFTESEFPRYFGNTLFLMMGLPLSIAGALGAALLLSREPGGKTRRVHGMIVGSAVMIACSLLLAVLGFGGTAFFVLLASVAGGILVMGTIGGKTVYRTLFFVPHFVSGVPVFLLWKKMYNPQTGPINRALRPVLNAVARAVNALPDPVVQTGYLLLLAAMVACLWYGIRRMRRLWNDGEVGWVAASVAVALMGLPFLLLQFWSPVPAVARLTAVAALLCAVWVGRGFLGEPDFTADADKRLGGAALLAAGLTIVELICLGLGAVVFNLPEAAVDGLEPPSWLASYHWAKPALILIGLWGSIGGRNMILYLAGLTNIPRHLYEAADIDGATPWQRFWHITWPQLAPITFFIVIMSVIGGLKGGFQMARTMTRGGPAGATTMLSYFIYEEGFETGRLGFACSVAWAMFLIIFVVTLFNWKFGNRYVNE